MKVTLSGSPQYAAELCDVDWQGNPLRGDSRKRFCVLVDLECVSADHTIDVALSLISRIALERMPNLENAARRIAAAATTLRAATEILPRRPEWQFYDTTEIYIPDGTPVEGSPDSIEFETELAEGLSAHLVSMTTRHCELDQAFESAKEFLTRHIHSAPYYAHDLVEAANFLARCMRADGDFFMGAWNREKSGSLLSAVSDLTRRKNTSHPGYAHSAEKAQGILYSIRSPKVWAGYPPLVRHW